jgi:hypothetical protein
MLQRKLTDLFIPHSAVCYTGVNEKNWLSGPAYFVIHHRSTNVYRSRVERNWRCKILILTSDKTDLTKERQDCDNHTHIRPIRNICRVNPNSGEYNNVASSLGKPQCPAELLTIRFSVRRGIERALLI